jgi:hypothetical protein
VRASAPGAAARAVAGLALLLIFAFVLQCRRTQAEIVQPLEFPHSVHLALQDPRLECRSCHEGVETGLAAGRPTTSNCLSCHGGEAESEVERTLQELTRDGAEIEWVRIWGLPPGIFFSHRQHVVTAGIACETCHGDVGALDRPPRRPLVTLSMSDCMRCHERWVWPEDTPPALAARPIAGDCAACHR